MCLERRSARFISRADRWARRRSRSRRRLQRRHTQRHGTSVGVRLRGRNTKLIDNDVLNEHHVKCASGAAGSNDAQCRCDTGAPRRVCAGQRRRHQREQRGRHDR